MNEIDIQIEPSTSDYGLFVEKLNALIDLEAKSARNLPPMHHYAYRALEKEREVGGIFGFDNFGALHIEGLWVHPDFRRKGIGKSLVLAAERLAFERACKCVVLFTMDFQAPAFYQAMGYQVEFRRSAYHGDSTATYMIKKISG